MGESKKETGMLLLLLLQALVMASELQTASAVETVVGTPFITASTSQFGLGIEGVAVDQLGNVYAVGFSGDGTSGIGSVANSTGEVMQKLLTKDQTGLSSFNGLRFLPASPNLPNFDLRAVAADVKRNSVVLLLRSKRDHRTRGSTFCKSNDASRHMKQPNDVAVAPRSGRIYMSGGDYGKVNTVVGDGDLWMCQAKSPFTETAVDGLGDLNATFLGHFGLTNGIEVSPDEKTLYLTESFHVAAEPYSNIIWKFDIDENGGVHNRQIFVNFTQLDDSGWVDLDGIRTDVEGNLFVTKNGLFGQTDKFHPNGTHLLTIQLPTIFETTNLEFGGPEGKTLYMSGKCIDDPDRGCVEVWNSTVPGRAWNELRSSSVTNTP
ncbi:hypothetical protein Mapa_004633 [Marchantia paleacea]|nr:hypothetical protein Mapa_004633 [Marchantia paleacea]